MPRIRPRSIRIFIPWISRAATGQAFGRLRDVFLFWIEQGVRIFRVDNPHTKAFPFWEWAIRGDQAAISRRAVPGRGVHAAARDAAAGEAGIFAVLHLLHLAQHQAGADGISDRADTRRRSANYFAPNLWPNTPDILPEILQIGGRPAFISRLVLAATLGANYGIYGAGVRTAARTRRASLAAKSISTPKNTN